MSKKACLIILDGWGNGAKDESDAVFAAHTPFIDSLYDQYPCSYLRTDGLNVGLPEGQMGNSEVGHMNIGAGRVVYQDLVMINKSIADGMFFNNPVLLSAFKKAKESGKKLHFMGLLGHGGVHASQNHLVALCQAAHDFGIQKTFVHAFTDGRDTDPHSAKEFMASLENDISIFGGEVATVIGRYFAMDRDHRWERIKKAYDLLVHNSGTEFSSAIEGIENSYNNEITDEFIEPFFVRDSSGKAKARIEEGDIVICFNYRTDRCRELSEALTQRDFPEFEMRKQEIQYFTMTSYDRAFKNVGVLFEKDTLKNTLGEHLSKNNKTQLRIAETEKYPHVSFFFSGGREDEFSGENRIMIPSPKVATYDLAPEMSAPMVTRAVTDYMETEGPDFICLNFANPDMVGHTGVFEAIIKACETVDECLYEVVEKGIQYGYSFVIIADHGNADVAVNKDGSPNTAHSLNPVPIIIIDKEIASVEHGILADVAPTILRILKLDQPSEMTGRSLV